MCKPACACVGADLFDRLKDRLLVSGPGRWYAAKEPREKLTFAALAAVTLVVFLWAGLWKPMADWQATQATRHGNARSLLEWMQINESRVRAAVDQGTIEPSRSILPIVTRAAEARGLKVGRLQPESDGVVSVTLQGQSFNDVIRWIAELDDTEKIGVIRVSVDAQDTPGLVNAQLRLQ